MATLAKPQPTPLQRERTFYFILSLVFLAAAVAGFGFFFAIGASSFASRDSFEIGLVKPGRKQSSSISVA